MKQNRLLTALLLVLLLALPLTAGAAAFPDVADNHWATAEIREMAARGVVRGNDDGTFRPDGEVTAAHFVTMVTNLYYQDELQGIQNPVPQWWGSAAALCQDKGLLDGTAVGGTFWRSATAAGWDAALMDAPLTRYDMAQVMANILEEQGVPGSDANELERAERSIADFDRIPLARREAVLTAYALRCLSGMDDGTFSGSRNMTRAQACRVLCNLIDARERMEEEAAEQARREQEE
ncbi:MAG: S-layer homology domain-containing protein, partial [Clostridia bacterium]|nr:S-layer homology domain-containing protein [Clostridia bacterium]